MYYYVLFIHLFIFSFRPRLKGPIKLLEKEFRPGKARSRVNRIIYLVRVNVVFEERRMVAGKLGCSTSWAS